MSESRSEFETAQDEEVWAAFCDMKKDGQKIQIEDVLAFGNRCWQASRRAALEEAAKVCFDLSTVLGEEAGDASYECCLAIRAIARKEKA